MQVGDLVRCTWQPRTSHVEDDCAVPMKLAIKGELGVIVGKRGEEGRDSARTIVLDDSREDRLQVDGSVGILKAELHRQSLRGIH